MADDDDGDSLSQDLFAVRWLVSAVTFFAKTGDKVKGFVNWVRDLFRPPPSPPPAPNGPSYPEWPTPFAPPGDE